MPTNRSAGRGTHTAGGVRGTFKAPFGKATNAREGTGGGRYGSIAAPFDKPQSMGGGGIPVKMMDGMPSPSAVRTKTAGQVTPPIRATQNVGQRRFKNPR